MRELWKAGNFFEAIKCFGQRIQEGSLSPEEIENFNRNLVEFREFVELRCEENGKVLFGLYEMLKKTRNWDDQTLWR